MRPAASACPAAGDLGVRSAISASLNVRSDSPWPRRGDARAAGFAARSLQELTPLPCLPADQGRAGQSGPRLDCCRCLGDAP